MIKKTLSNVIICSSAILFFSCSTDDDVISPFESYRYQLWGKSIDNGWELNYIGTQRDTYTYPDYLGHTFDRDHEGVGSIETDGVLINLAGVLSTIEQPDVVLLGIGINDLLSGDEPGFIIRNVITIVNILQHHNPNVTIFLEQIAPARSDLMTRDLTNRIVIYNNLIRHFSERLSNANSEVIPVDMYTEFSSFYFADVVHYNDRGAQFIANKYMSAIESKFTSISSLKILPLGDSRVVGYR